MPCPFLFGKMVILKLIVRGIFGSTLLKRKSRLEQDGAILTFVFPLEQNWIFIIFSIFTILKMLFLLNLHIARRA